MFSEIPFWQSRGGGEGRKSSGQAVAMVALGVRINKCSRLGEVGAKSPKCRSGLFIAVEVRVVFMHGLALWKVWTASERMAVWRVWLGGG